MVQGHTPLERYFTGPDIKFHFPYEVFAWLPVLPAPWIHAVIAVLAVAGVSMALGFRYRASAVTVFLAWGYLFVVESTRTYWQSYYYVELLFAFLMIWTPAARRYSVDAWLARGGDRPLTVPCWSVWLLRGQLVITYFYAGVSKLNLDWLLDAVPVRWDLAEAHATTTYGPYLTAAQLQLLERLLHSVPFAYFVAYVGVTFDLTIGWLLLIRRTRVLAMILMVIFHAINHFIIFDNIDWFPLVGVTTATIFLDPDWPERFWNWIRRPQIVKPDWGWLMGGAILVPAIGAALGWKLKATHRPPELAHSASPELGRWVAPLVVVWLVSQALLPIRHYFIPGDGRFTYEGLSFSWRPKADDHRALSAQIFVDDPAILSRDNSGRTRIDWNQWRGEKVIYRRVASGRLDWQRLPEIVVLLEPGIGERLVYNPLAGSSALRTEAEARERVGLIWRGLYGRPPAMVRPTEPLSRVLESLSAGLDAAGLREDAANLAGLVPRAKQLDQNQLQSEEAMKTFRAVREALNALQSRDENGNMMPYLRALDPFAPEAPTHPPRPFLAVEDPLLFQGSGGQPRRINLAVWKTGGHPGGPRASLDVYVGGEPLVIYMGDIGPTEAKSVLPQVCILDSEDHPERPPYIWWNSLRDLSASKLMHVSNQAFYLRRYARRVAGLWEADYGRRPAVRAQTAVSLNGRPYQLLVDPGVDLASVPVVWFGHNAWIKDLETPRIPRPALTQRPINRSN